MNNLEFNKDYIYFKNIVKIFYYFYHLLIFYQFINFFNSIIILQIIQLYLSFYNPSYKNIV